MRSRRKEWQLVAITYSGDWYRLKIPDPDTAKAFDEPGQERDQEDGKIIKKDRCQLVEYRRLGVGGGGW